MMKKATLIALLTITMSGYAQSDNKYDPLLAEKHGADDYGMKSYVLVILKSGPNSTADKEQSAKLFQGHMENIQKLAADGKLVVAGPMQKNDKSYRGIFILNVKTVPEAEHLLQSDPAIKEKLLDAELYGWYGSAALSEYLPFHDKIQKIKF